MLNRLTHCRSSAGIRFFRKIALVIAFVGAGPLLGQQLELFEKTESEERDIRGSRALDNLSETETAI